jgi:hypothetical protein
MEFNIDGKNKIKIDVDGITLGNNLNERKNQNMP